MGNFFNLDGPFFKFGNALADIMIIGLLWFVFSIPIVTIGASTTASFYVMIRRTSNRQGYITKDFFKSFKSNFKISTMIWLTVLVIIMISAFNLLNISVIGEYARFLLPVQYFIIIELTAISIYLFPILSRFEVSYFSLIKSAFFMANRHLITTITCIILLIGFPLISFNIGMLPVLLIFGGLYPFITSFLFIKVFRKYRPEIDKDYYDRQGNLIDPDEIEEIKDIE